MSQRRLAPFALVLLFGAGLAPAWAQDAPARAPATDPANAPATDPANAPAIDPAIDPATAQQNEAWAVRLARMEGASVHVEEAAGELTDTARRIADSGRVHALSDLASDAGQLNRRVVSLTLATEVLVELEVAPSTP